MGQAIIKLFLRIAIGSSFLSAVADRFGWWDKSHLVWGDWENFTAYTNLLNPWFPDAVIPAVAAIATLAEIVLGFCLLVGFRTELMAKLSGILLFLFGLAMAFVLGLKTSFDYSVFTASAGAFGLSLIKEKRWELDNLFLHK